MNATKNVKIAFIEFVEDQIYFGQGFSGHFVSKIWCKWPEGKCMLFDSFDLESDKNTKDSFKNIDPQDIGLV